MLHLDDRMSRRRGLDGSSAALCLIVGSVVWAGLHLNPQLILVKLGRQRPVEWRQSIRPVLGQKIIRLTGLLMSGEHSQGRDGQQVQMNNYLVEQLMRST